MQDGGALPDALPDVSDVQDGGRQLVQVRITLKATLGRIDWTCQHVGNPILAIFDLASLFVAFRILPVICKARKRSLMVEMSEIPPERRTVGLR
jgi:hypothetical protein